MKTDDLSHLPNFTDFPRGVPPSETAQISADFYNSGDVKDSIIYVIGTMNGRESLIYSHEKPDSTGICRYAESIPVSRVEKYNPVKIPIH